MTANPQQNGNALYLRRELVGQLADVIWSQRDADGPGAIIARLAPGSEVIVGDQQDGELEYGTVYRFLGKWQQNPKYGWQFRFDSYVLDTPADRAGIVAYLQRCAGMTEHKAELCWDRYAAATVEVLRSDAARVADDGLFTLWKATEIADKLERLAAHERTTIDLFTIFAGRGFPRTTVSGCIRKWGVKAAELVRRDPFRLLVADIAGVGFKRADALYTELGGNPTRLKRQFFAAWAALRETDGDTWAVEGVARRAIGRVVGFGAAKFDRAIALGIRAGWFSTRRDSAGTLYIAERQNAQDESAVARHVARLMRAVPAGQTLWPAWIHEPAFEHQRAQWSKVAASPVVIINGVPGSGKTFTAALAIRALIARIGKSSIAVCAPTGKAAVRITETMAKHGVTIEATTIHRLLEIGRNGRDKKGWNFQRNEEMPLAQRFIIVDESSMLSIALTKDLLAACADGTHLLFIGDVGQLPPIEHGAPLRDFIDAGVPTATLTEIKRNAGLIVEACRDIKDGRRFKTCDRYDPDTGANLRLIECGGGDDPYEQLNTLRSIIAGVQKGGKFNPVWECQVLCALNEKSPISRVPLNEMLQSMLNPPREDESTDTGGSKFRRGDKIICLRNSLMQLYQFTGPLVGACPMPGDEQLVDSYRPLKNNSGELMEAFIANGDLGAVVAVDEHHAVCRMLSPERLVRVQLKKRKGDDAENSEGGAGCDFSLAYAATVHKFQGSEVPLAVVMIDPQATMVASREHHYTAISRASKLCVLIGQRSVLERQCRRVALRTRRTWLASQIKELLADAGSDVAGDVGGGAAR